MDEKKTDEDDALLEGESGSAAAEWVNHDWTRRLAKATRERYRVEMNKLFSMAQTSSDPRIAAQGAAIKELRVAMNLLTGAVAK